MAGFWLPDGTAAVLLQCCARDNTHGARYWWRPVLDGGGRHDFTDELFVQGFLGGVCTALLPCNVSAGVKLAFHGADKDFLARILARKSRVSDVRMQCIDVSGESESVSVSASWNASFRKQASRDSMLRVS